MKKAFSFIVSIVWFCNASYCQNVGIGTNIPTAKLEVKNGGLSTVKISSLDFNDTSQLILSNRNGINGTDFILSARKESGLFFTAASDLVSFKNDSMFTILRNGNVGVATTTPSAKLDVNGGVKIQGLNLMEFGAGIAGKEINAGKIGYNAFGTNALTFVGGGTTVNNRSVFFFAEGGSTFNGPLTVLGNSNFSGQLRLNGNTGTAGQVLTSNGSADPTWQTLSAPFSNDVRFSLTLSNNTTTSGDLTFNNRINTNPAAVVVSGTTLTFSQTGIYHFEGNVSGRVDYLSAIAYNPDFSLNFYVMGGTGFGNNPVGSVKLEKSRTSITYSNSVFFDIDLYITAGQSLRISFGYDTPAGYFIIDSFGYLRGYLISN